MKLIKSTVIIALSAAIVAAPFSGLADEKKPALKPYTLKTCVVSDEKLGGEMGKPFVTEYKDQEIKLCCKSCKKDFDKDPAKYIKKMAKLEAAEKKAAADKSKSGK